MSRSLAKTPSKSPKPTSTPPASMAITSPTSFSSSSLVPSSPSPLSPSSSSSMNVPKQPLQLFKTQLKAQQTLHNRTNLIEFHTDVIDIDLARLNQEMKDDSLAIGEYNKQLLKLSTRKDALLRLIADNERFIHDFNAQIGPFEHKYASLRHNIDELHHDAKQKYDKALQLLTDKLGYHPTFKRWNDTI